MVGDTGHITRDKRHIVWDEHSLKISLFCLLALPQEGGGGLPDSKDDEEHCLLLLGHFSSKILEDDQSPNTLRNFCLYKIRFKKKFLKGV